MYSVEGTIYSPVNDIETKVSLTWGATGMLLFAVHESVLNEY